MNTSNSSNGSAIPVTDFASWRLPFYINYIIFGGLALVVNLTILATLIKQTRLLARWPIVSALAFGNLSSALHSFVYGVYRTVLILSGTIDLPLSSWVCMATMMPTCHVLAYSVAPVIQCIIGIERIVAICAFNWYRVHWTAKKTWRVIIVVLLITTVASAAPLWYKVFSVHLMVTRECSSPRIVGLDYLFAEIRFAIIIGVASASFSIAAAVIGRFRSKKMMPAGSSNEYVSQFKRQLKLSWAMLTVAVFDLALVTVPSILTVVQLSFEMPNSAKVSLYSLSYCVYSTINVVVCVAMNPALRNPVRKMITCQANADTVEAITASQRGLSRDVRSASCWAVEAKPAAERRPSRDVRSPTRLAVEAIPAAERRLSRDVRSPTCPAVEDIPASQRRPSRDVRSPTCWAK